MKTRFLLFASILTIGLSGISNLSTGQPNKPTACDLKSDMRSLWMDHVMWTRNVIFNIIDSLPGTDEAVNRLQDNQDHIGDAIKPYYGDAAGNQLADLLHNHISIAAEI